MVEVIFGVRKDQFQAYPSIPTGLDLVYEKDEYTHMITLDDHRKKEPMLGMGRFSINLIDVYPFLDVFQFDEQYEKNERKYKQIRKIILDETSDDEYESSENSSSSNAEDDQENNVVNEEKEQTFDDEESK
jgi:pre-mRNA-splicing factor CWC22